MRGRSKLGLPLSFLGLALSLLAAACSGNPFLTRAQQAERIASEAGWIAAELDTEYYRIRLFHPARPARSSQVVVYLEGDGLAWIDRATPSADPTPKDPLGLRLAVAVPAAASAYIARPCQYTLARDRARCTQAAWTHARYSPPVVEAVSRGVDRLKSLYGAHEVVLVGYSGGGVVAALLAARRDDVSLLVTVAANLDIEFWTRLHGVTPLVGSLNPADAPEKLKRQRQVHFVGSDDEIVPGDVARAYAMKVDEALLRSIRIVEDADHT